MFDKRYRLDAMLGRGGMGAVFRAHHLGLRQDVALKILRPELSAGKSAAARFAREARSASRLDHQNCVRVTDFGELDDGTKYLVMQLLEGRELKQMLGHPWLASEAIDAVLQILAGLEHAHRHGVVHRDLKPENVIVTRDDRGAQQLRLVDFGIAKILDDAGADAGADAKLTHTGMVFGTPRYMSPEQATGGKVDARTDLYAVGLVLYEMLAGQPPFVAEDAAALVRMHILLPPPPLPDSLPASLRAVVMRLLEKSRADRYATASEVIAALEQARAQVVAQRVGAIAVAAAPVSTTVASATVPIPSAAQSSLPPLSPTQPTVTQAATRAVTHAATPAMTPGYTVPAYGPAPTDPPRRKSMLPWVIAGAAILVLLGVGVGVMLASGDTPPDRRASPIDAEDREERIREALEQHPEKGEEKGVFERKGKDKGKGKGEEKGKGKDKKKGR